MTVAIVFLATVICIWLFWLGYRMERNETYTYPEILDKYFPNADRDDNEHHSS